MHRVLSPQVRRVSSALLILLLLHSTVSTALASPGENRSESNINSEFSKKVFDNVSELVNEYYSKVKFDHKGNKIHFEYKVRPFVAAGQRTEIAPDFGGILGDVELRKGEYKGHERMPQQYAEYSFYSIVKMAPYSKDYNCHLYTRLSYPEGTTQEFVDRFKDLINSLGRNSGSGGSALSPLSVPGDLQKNRTSKTETPPVQARKPSDSTVGAASGTEQKLSSIGYASNSVGSPNSVDLKSNSHSPVQSGNAPNGTNATTTPNDATATEHRGRRAYIWRATKGKDVIYLLGTIHGSIQQFYPLPPVIDKAFEQSKHLVVEIDIQHMDESKIPALVQNLSRYKPPDKLSNHLSPQTKRVFDKFLEYSGGTWEMYEEYKPWFAARLATGTLQWDFKDFRSSLGIDLYLLNRARELKKAVSDLETPELQIRASSDNSDAAQDAMLCSSILDIKNAGNYIKELLAIWKEGNLDKMYEATKRDTVRFPALAEYDKRMLDDRNVGMANKVEQLLNTKPGPHFVAVGAAHMPGPMGLVNIFKERGYSVEQLYSEDDLKPLSTAVTSASSSANKAVATASATTASTSSGNADSVGSDTSSSTAPSTYNKQTFVEQFRVWLPGTPKRVIDDPNTNHYEFSEPPFGGFTIFRIALDKPTTTWTDPGPLVLDRILSPFPKTAISQQTITLQGFTGRELICIPRSPAEREQLEDDADREAISEENAVAKGAKKEVDFGPYMAALQRKIKKNWVPSARSRTKRILVSWDAGKTGTITKLKLDRSSGDSDADQVALQAVRRSVPFAPLPPGSPQTVSIQFHFDYNVIHQSDNIGAIVKGAPGLRISPRITTFTDFMTSGKDGRFEKVSPSDIRARIQAYLVHRSIFIVGACGTKEWLDSDNAKRFFDSFELIAH